MLHFVDKRLNFCGNYIENEGRNVADARKKTLKLLCAMLHRADHDECWKGCALVAGSGKTLKILGMFVSERLEKTTLSFYEECFICLLIMVIVYKTPLSQATIHYSQLSENKSSLQIEKKSISGKFLFGFTLYKNTYSRFR